MTQWQGSLDSMCGVYSVINAAKRMFGRHLSISLQAKLYERLTAKLDAEGRLTEVVSGDGISVKVLVKLIEVADLFAREELGLGISWKPAGRRRDLGLPSFWRVLTDHLGKEQSAIIMRMDGRLSHWTTIDRITPSSLALKDSCGLSRIYRFRSTTGAPTTRRIHSLWPTQTYLMTVDEH